MEDLRSFLTHQLLAEHSRPQAERIAAWIGQDQDRFSAFMAIFLDNEYRLIQRAAWVLSIIGDKNQAVLAPWLPQMVAKLRQPDLHDAVKRNTIRIFETIHIPENLHEEVIDICFGFLADKNEAIAIRVFSMTVLERLCQHIPELMQELKWLIETNFDHESAAFKSRGRKILAKIAQQKPRN